MRGDFVASILTVGVGCGAPAAQTEAISNTPTAAAVEPGPTIEGPFVRGEIRVHPKAHSRAVANRAVFVWIKRVNTHGQPHGPPVAIAKLAWAEPLPFTLTNEHAMLVDDAPWGDVIVNARYDQDGDALNKQPGDLLGSTRVHAPADGVVVVLDEVVQ